MILTGKAKEYFLRYYGDEISHLEEIEYDFLLESSIIRNALIIEWFDSVGIYIEVYRHNNRPTVQGFNSRIVRRTNSYYECCTAVDTRCEANKYAIKKANEIYNEKYSISQ